MAASVPVVLASNQSTLNVIGPLTDTQLRASAVSVINTPIGNTKVTYSASALGLSAANTPTDIFTIQGSATKKITITRIAFTASQTTAAQRDVVLLKRSTLDTGGTSTVLTSVAHDSTSVAATGVARFYTANPTAVGTLSGNLRTRKVFIGTATANSDEMILDFGIRPSQAIVLNNVNESLAINLNAITSAGNLIDLSVEWTEE
jgi:hypothetical protein